MEKKLGNKKLNKGCLTDEEEEVCVKLYKMIVCGVFT